MDIFRLLAGILLIVMVVLTVRLAVHADAWRSAVSALHLRWEREQRQAGPADVTLSQRQAVQAEFEQLVANRPFRLMWLHLMLGVVAVAYAVLLAWNQDDLRETGLWLVLPIGLSIVGVLAFAWALVNQANSKLAAISSTLYGPAPPRVKVKAIRTVDAEKSEN